MRAWACILAICAGQVCAEIVPESYDRLEDELGARLDFEGFDAGSEPGRLFAQISWDSGATVGASLAGYPRTETRLPPDAGGGRHHAPTDGAAPTRPLRLADIGGIVLAQHRGFGSTALFPVGPDGAARASGRGEGLMTVLFAQDQPAIGIRIHPDYPDPLGTRPAPGPAILHFWDRRGSLIGRTDIDLVPGINSLGFRSLGPGIAAITLWNRDPGGIAVDDILFKSLPPLG